MGLKNPQADFEDGIFGQGGMHPTPASLPYPSQPLKTIYGETVEYLIPAGQKEKVLKKLYPFGDPPPLDTVLVDIHAHREFTVRDFKVVEQNGYVMPVSPYFAEDGASVVDWEPKKDAEAGVHVAKMSDEAVENAYGAGFTDGFTGMAEGAAKPSRPEGMEKVRWEAVEAAYADGFRDGCAEREDRQAEAFSLFFAGSNRRTGRRPQR